MSLYIRICIQQWGNGHDDCIEPLLDGIHESYNAWGRGLSEKSLGAVAANVFTAIVHLKELGDDLIYHWKNTNLIH